MNQFFCKKTNRKKIYWKLHNHKNLKFIHVPSKRYKNINRWLHVLENFDFKIPTSSKKEEQKILAKQIRENTCVRPTIPLGSHHNTEESNEKEERSYFGMNLLPFSYSHTERHNSNSSGYRNDEAY